MRFLLVLLLLPSLHAADFYDWRSLPDLLTEQLSGLDPDRDLVEIFIESRAMRQGSLRRVS